MVFPHFNAIICQVWLEKHSDVTRMGNVYDNIERYISLLIALPFNAIS